MYSVIILPDYHVEQCYNCDALNFIKVKLKIPIFIIDGRKEDVHFDKITSRIAKQCYNLDMNYIDPVSIIIYLS